MDFKLKTFISFLKSILFILKTFIVVFIFILFIIIVYLFTINSIYSHPPYIKLDFEVQGDIDKIDLIDCSFYTKYIDNFTAKGFNLNASNASNFIVNGTIKNILTDKNLENVVVQIWFRDVNNISLFSKYILIEFIPKNYPHDFYINFTSEDYYFKNVYLNNTLFRLYQI